MNKEFEVHTLAAGHAEAGWNKAVRRCMRLRKLLQRARSAVVFGGNEELTKEIDTALEQTFQDESEAFPPSGWENKT